MTTFQFTPLQENGCILYRGVLSYDVSLPHYFPVLFHQLCVPDRAHAMPCPPPALQKGISQVPGQTPPSAAWKSPSTFAKPGCGVRV